MSGGRGAIGAAAAAADPTGLCHNRARERRLGVDLKNLAGRARKLIDSRGGTASLKEDAMELKDIAAKDESLADKAKDAVEAIMDPGAPGDEPAPKSS
jgi:hypothetical protein